MITRGLIYASQAYRGEATPAAGVLSLDRSREKNNGTETDITYTRLPGKFWALSLNGTSSYISLPAFDTFTFEDFSVDAWVKLDSITGTQPIFNHGESQLFGFGWNFIVYDGKLQLHTFQAGFADQTTESAAIISTGTWYHVGARRSGAAAEVFVNGVDVTDVAGVHVDPDPASTFPWIGHSFSNPNHYYFDGMIGIIRVCKRNLSSFSEIYGSEKSLFGLGG